MKPFSTWLVLSTQGLSPHADNSLSSLLTQLGHEGTFYSDLASQLRSKAYKYLRQEAAKLIRRYTVTRISRVMERWKGKGELGAAALQYRKLRTYAVKLTREIKESQRVKVEIKSARPAESKIPVPKIATEKLSEERHRGRSRSISKDKENQRTEVVSKPIPELKEPRVKRPISVPPKRHPDDSLLTKVQTEARNRAAGYSSKPPASDSEVAGHRLYQHAQEIERRREMMRKSMEPEYSFTPQITQSTEKWLLHKVSKGGKGVEGSRPQDEVAVVSSAAALSFLSTNSSADCKCPLSFTSTPKPRPLIPILSTNLPKLKLMETEESLSKRYADDSDSQNLSIVEYDPIETET